MTNDYKFAAYRREHIRRNLPGIGALFFLMAVLRSEVEIFMSFEHFSRFT